MHDSLRPGKAYVHRVRGYRIHGLRHPSTLGGAEVEAFLSWLASARRISSSTRKQALSGLLFFYAKVLGIDLPWMKETGRPRGHRRLSVVLSRVDVFRILTLLDGEHRLLAQLLYSRGCASPRRANYELRDLAVRSGRSAVDGTADVRFEDFSGPERPVMAESRQSRFQIARRKPVIQRSPERKIWTAPPTAGHGRVRPVGPRSRTPPTAAILRIAALRLAKAVQVRAAEL